MSNNQPTNFVDPSGLLMAQLYNCVPIYKADGGQFLGYICQVHWTNDPNAGIGGSSGGIEVGGVGETQQSTENFCDKYITQISRIKQAFKVAKREIKQAAVNRVVEAYKEFGQAVANIYFNGWNFLSYVAGIGVAVSIAQAETVPITATLLLGAVLSTYIVNLLQHTSAFGEFSGRVYAINRAYNAANDKNEKDFYNDLRNTYKNALKADCGSSLPSLEYVYGYN